MHLDQAGHDHLVGDVHDPVGGARGIAVGHLGDDAVLDDDVHVAAERLGAAVEEGARAHQHRGRRLRARPGEGGSDVLGGAGERVDAAQAVVAQVDEGPRVAGPGGIVGGLVGEAAGKVGGLAAGGHGDRP